MPEGTTATTSEREPRRRPLTAIPLPGPHTSQHQDRYGIQIIESAIRVDSLQQAVQANPIDKFQLVFRQVLESLFIERMDMNEDLFARFMNEPELRDLIAQALGQKVYERLPKSLAYSGTPRPRNPAAPT